jgi:putative hemolysin
VSLVVEITVLAASLAIMALLAGAETAFFRVSPVRLDMEARAKSRAAAIVQRLARDRVALALSFVVGIQVCLAILAWRGSALLAALRVPDGLTPFVLCALAVPVVLVFGELLPKEVCRRRPHAALRLAAPLVLAVRVVAAPLVALLSLAVRLSGREGGAGLAAGAQGRETVLGFLREGTQSGALSGPAEEMAKNVLLLRSIPVERCMVVWSAVVRVRASSDDATIYATVGRSQHTRVPVEGDDGRVLGYLHQLDVLGDGEGAHPLDRLRPIPELAPDLPVDRALHRLRAAGQRLAIVGSSSAPVGIVTLKDLLEEISGDLVRW